MSLKNLLVGLLYRYKLVKQAVLNEYVKEARQRQLQYQQRIQQLINLHKADSLVKKANLISNLYQQALLAKLAATAQNKVADDGKGALAGILGGPGSVLGSGGIVGVPQLNSGEVDLGVRGAVRDVLKGVLSRVDRAEQGMRQIVRDIGRSLAEAGQSNEGSGGGGFFSETAKALMENANKNQGGSAGPSDSGKGSGGIAVAPPPRPLIGSGDGSGSDSDQQQQPDDSGLWSKVLSALNEHKGQIALGAGGGLLALLGGALLAKKLRNRKRKKNTAQTPSSDAAAAATAVEQELKDLITSTQKQQKKK